jgi:hypothetical protein
MKRTAIAIAAVVALVGALGTARAESLATHACIAALNAGREACIGAAHDADQDCMIKALKLRGAAKNQAVRMCSDQFGSTSRLCTQHYDADVAECRGDKPLPNSDLQ